MWGKWRICLQRRTSLYSVFSSIHSPLEDASDIADTQNYVCIISNLGILKWSSGAFVCML